MTGGPTPPAAAPGTKRRDGDRPAARRRRPPRREPMESQTRATILLVEDDPGIARLERLRLERAGYAVVAAATAEEGLRRVAEGDVALIVLDQQLTSATSGLEFFRQVKAAGYHVPAILVTGIHEENMLVEAL